MSRMRKPAALAAAVLGLVFFAPPAGPAEFVDRVVASANNDVITLSDLRQAVAFNEIVSGKGSGRRVAAETLEGLINRKLLLQEAYRLHFVEVTEQDVAEETDRFRRRFSGGKAYEDFLSGTGMSEDQLGRTLGEQLMVERFVERKIEMYARVSRDEALAYYQEHAAEFAGRRFAEVQKQISALLSGQMAEQQLDNYLAELRERANIRINPLQERDGF